MDGRRSPRCLMPLYGCGIIEMSRFGGVKTVIASFFCKSIIWKIRVVLFLFLGYALLVILPFPWKDSINLMYIIWKTFSMPTRVNKVKIESFM